MEGESSDVNVKVIYDFEYTAKDGKQVKISEGEKLYLIKKTNEDWWQVIRNTGRPFYVPASYVQQINNKQDAVTDKYYHTAEKMKIQSEMYRNRSCSVESQKTYDNHKHNQTTLTTNNVLKSKPIVPPRTYFDKISKSSSAMRFSNPKNFDIKEENYPEQTEDDEEEGDYVNLPKENKKCQIQDRNYSDNSLSASLSSTDSDKVSVVINHGTSSTSTAIPDISLKSSSYSHVNIKKSASKAVLNDSNHLTLNLTNSLEELSQEINKKSILIHNADSKPAKSSSDPKSDNSTTGYSKVSNIVKHITKDPAINLKNMNQLSNVNNSLKPVSNNNRSVNLADSDLTKNKLQYAGSFKTKHEREKWAKNYVLLTAMKEEEITENQNSNFSNNTCTKFNTGSPEKFNPNFSTSSGRINCTGNVDNNFNNKNTSITATTNNNSSDDIKNNVFDNKKLNVKTTVSAAENDIKLTDGSSSIDKLEITAQLLQSDNRNISTGIKISDRINNYQVKLVENNSVRTSADCSKQSPSSSSADYRIKASLNSSSEELGQSPVNTASIDSSRLSGASDRGSTDSLLDVDHQLGSLQDGSTCTTASDSLLQSCSDFSDEEFSKLLSLDKSDSSNKKKPVLSRNARVESCRLRFPVRGVSPPIPEPNQLPSKELFGGWSEYTFTDGRTFFYNCKTGEKSWKPPRRRSSAEKTRKQIGCGNTGNSVSSENHHNNNSDDDNSHCLGKVEEVVESSNVIKPVLDHRPNDRCTYSPPSALNNTIIPAGWRAYTDPDNGLQYYVNGLSGSKWFSSKDDEGRVYYFEEHSSESSWTLPDIIANFSSTENIDDENYVEEEEEGENTGAAVYSNIPPPITRSSTLATIGSKEIVASELSSSNLQTSRSAKTKSMIILDPPPKNEEAQSSILVSKNWPQLWDGHMCVLKEGTLNRTKITENGKRLRKNWASSHVVLTELFLLFFKDAKAFAAFKSGNGRPEMCVDLNGALIDRGDKISSRRNVYIISTVLGMQVLIQSDCIQQADLWLLAIQSAIKNLPSGFDSCPRLTRGTVVEPENISPESESSKKFYKVTRSKSVKTEAKSITTTNKDCGSIEDLTVSPAERQTKIKARLKKFFHRRPTVESLIKKGIWKDEPAFGCYLEKVCPSESPRVPLFVQRCITCIEKFEENMKTDGLYRASGNLSQVQKIRLQVDQNNLSVIEEEDDVHVLTGALKLFFRELKEPLIPYHSFQKSIKASNNPNRKEKIVQFKEIAKSLPQSNYDTLKYLLQHLLRVTKYKEFNRMHIPNLAIVFGPTLMWPEQESINMALDLMQQNLVIECFLLEFDNIFK